MKAEFWPLHSNCLLLHFLTVVWVSNFTRAEWAKMEVPSRKKSIFLPFFILVSSIFAEIESCFTLYQSCIQFCLQTLFKRQVWKSISCKHCKQMDYSKYNNTLTVRSLLKIVLLNLNTWSQYVKGILQVFPPHQGPHLKNFVHFPLKMLSDLELWIFRNNMYDATSNELDKIILGNDNISSVNPMMLYCLFIFNPDYVTYKHFMICIIKVLNVGRICRKSRATPPPSWSPSPYEKTIPPPPFGQNMNG